jgi:uncharacterized protein
MIAGSAKIVAENSLMRRCLAIAARMMLVASALVAMAGMPRTEEAGKPPSANAVKMAREIIELKGSGGLVAPLVAGVIERVKALHLQTNPNLRKDLDEVAISLRKQFAPRVGELLNEIAKFYASAFTEPELKEVLTFYRTPTGKKMIAIEPDLLADAFQGLKGWQEDFGEEVLARFRTEMKKRGKNL